MENKLTPELRQDILELYEHKCNLCGESDKRKLQIHHLDKCPQNNSLDNLICVCAYCHFSLFHSEKFEEGIMWWENKFKEVYF